MITEEQLSKIYIHSSKSNRDKYLSYLNKFMVQYEINTPIRIQMFLAQIGHESAELLYVEELASGKAYDTGKLAINLGNTPEADGDGQRYKGRGLVQITGTSNYKMLSKALDVDFVNYPELLELPKYAVQSACWFWKTKGLNEIADSGDFIKVTKRINGGINGLQDRYRIFELVKKYIK